MVGRREGCFRHPLILPPPPLQDKDVKEDPLSAFGDVSLNDDEYGDGDQTPMKREEEQ